MSEPVMLVRVPREELPLRVQVLLDSGMPLPAGSRFKPRRTHLSWAPAAWLIALVVVGISSLRATVAAGLDPTGGAERIIYGTMTAICLFFAAFSARMLMLGLSERRDLQRGHYRQGLHVLGREGLLIAGREEHTWVPRALLPHAIDVTPPGGGSPAFAFVLVDDRGRMERLNCGVLTQSTLWLWAEHGQLPEGDGWR